LSPAACESTYSYAMTSALAHSLSGSTVTDIGKRWSDVRRLTKQPVRSPTVEELSFPWAILCFLGAHGRSVEWSGSLRGGDATAIVSACQELLQHGEIPLSLLPAATHLPKSLLSEIRGQTREERVAVFETMALRASAGDARGSQFEAFQLAYLASQISPGTFEHFELLTPYLTVHPTILVWYGLLAGLTPTSQKLGGGLGLRVLRDALMPEYWLDRPTCDVSFFELEILLTAENPQTDFRVGSQSQLVVELAPAVRTILRWPPKPESAGELFPDRVSVAGLRDLMTEINSTFRDLNAVRSKMSRLLNLPEEDREKRNPRSDNRNKK